MLPDGSDLVAEEMNEWMDLNGMEFYIHYRSQSKKQLNSVTEKYNRQNLAVILKVTFYRD